MTTWEVLIPGHPEADSGHPDPDMAPTLWRGYATEAGAEARARELLDDFKRRSLPVARDVLVAVIRGHERRGRRPTCCASLAAGSLGWA